MTEQLEPKRAPSELAQQRGHMLSRWLYGEIASGRGVTVEQVRAKVEQKPITYDECSDAYHIALEDNEQQRTLATEASSREDFEMRNLHEKVSQHEDIAFLIMNAETAMAQDAGIFD